MKLYMQKIFNLFGYQLSSLRVKNVKSFDQTIKKIYPQKKINIIDIGANVGQTIRRFKKLFINSTIYSIEPSIKAYEYLNKNFSHKKNVNLYNCAIGDKIENKILFDYQNHVLSSFHPINKKNKKNNRFKKNLVKVLTLDEFCKRNKLENINILKIDTQGNEVEVLEGGKNSLKKGFFELIEIEIIMGDYYQKYSSFFEIEKYLVKNKYRLIALDKRLNIFNDSRLYCNALYLRKDLYKKI